MSNELCITRWLEVPQKTHHYDMRDGVLRMKLRAATAGYILRKWSVDCSPDHCLRGPEYRLWLKDHLAIYGVKNAILAPGYKSQEQKLVKAEAD